MHDVNVTALIIPWYFVGIVYCLIIGQTEYYID